MLPPTTDIEPVVPEPDIPPIFMDLDTRSRWNEPNSEVLLPGFSIAELKGIDRAPSSFVTPIMVRRSIVSALAKDTLQTGIAFLIVLVQFTLAFDFEPGRISPLEVFGP